MRITTRGAFNNHAIVILDGPKSAALKVFACSARSREAGISVGMSKAKAEIWPNVLMLRRCQQNEDIAQTALLDCGFSVSRQVESTHPGTVLCDVTGTEKLLGSPKKIAEKLHGLTTQCGFTASIAIASNPDAALHAARGFSGITIVPFGKERDVLERLPIDILDSRPEILEALRNWGIRTFKDLAALPMPAIAQRFGPAGIRLQQMAKGISKRELIPVIPTTSFQERIEPEEPLDCLAGINVVLQTLLDQTLVRLKARSLAAKEIHVELGIEKSFDWDLRQIEARERSVKRSSDLRKIQFSDVTQDAELIFKLLQLELERRPPQGCVREISIEAIPAKMRFVQSDFLRANAPESVNLDLSLAHLRALNCENEQEAKSRVGFAVVNDSHNPNSFYVTNCLPQIPANAERELRDDELLEEPCYGIGRRINSRLKLRSKSDDGNTDVIMKGKKNRIATAAGPWLGNGDWWDKEHHWNREEWDLELQSRRRKGLYRSIHPIDSGEWFIERMYD